MVALIDFKIFYLFFYFKFQLFRQGRSIIDLSLAFIIESNILIIPTLLNADILKKKFNTKI